MGEMTKAELQAQLDKMQAELAAAKSRETEMNQELEASKAAQADLGKMVAELLAPDVAPVAAPAEPGGPVRIWSHYAGHRVNLPGLNRVVQFKPFFPGGGNRNVMTVVDGRALKQKVAYLEPGTRCFRGYYDIREEAELDAFAQLMTPTLPSGAINPYFNNALAPAPAAR